MLFGDTDKPLYEIKANLFKGLAHPYRIRILEILSAAPETSVAEMIAETGLEASHLSQHLSVLRKYRIVEAERRANTVYYCLAFPEIAELLRVARQLLTQMTGADAVRASAIQSLPAIPSSRANESSSTAQTASSGSMSMPGATR